jgi:hypothetical protein
MLYVFIIHLIHNFIMVSELQNYLSEYKIHVMDKLKYWRLSILPNRIKANLKILYNYYLNINLYWQNKYW